MSYIPTSIQRCKWQTILKYMYKNETQMQRGRLTHQIISWLYLLHGIMVFILLRNLYNGINDNNKLLTPTSKTLV